MIVIQTQSSRFVYLVRTFNPLWTDFTTTGELKARFKANASSHVASSLTSVNRSNYSAALSHEEVIDCDHIYKPTKRSILDNSKYSRSIQPLSRFKPHLIIGNTKIRHWWIHSFGQMFCLRLPIYHKCI